MKMSSSMYEVFNWNDSYPEPPLTPGIYNNKRASLTLPPTHDIYSNVDDYSIADIGYRRSTTRGESFITREIMWTVIIFWCILIIFLYQFISHYYLSSPILLYHCFYFFFTHPLSLKKCLSFCHVFFYLSLKP